jgi:hypothetical protein
LYVMQYGQQRCVPRAVGFQYISKLSSLGHWLNFSACHATCSAMNVEMKK